MTCAECTDILDQLLDGELTGTTARECEDHLNACAACTGELEFLKVVRRHAHAAPKRIVPARDLWPDIEARIAEGASKTFGVRLLRFPAWQIALATAAAVLVITGAIVLRLDSPALRTDRVADPQQIRGEIGDIEVEYLAAKNTLLAALEERRGNLSPETLSTVEDNLAIIETAIFELHDALQAHPEDESLGRLLAEAYKSEVTLLQNAVRIPAES